MKSDKLSDPPDFSDLLEKFKNLDEEEKIEFGKSLKEAFEKVDKELAHLDELRKVPKGTLQEPFTI